jgi:hypothetical protein
LRQSEGILTKLRATLKEYATQSAERSDRAKGFLRPGPEAKKVFPSTAAATKALPKEQAAAIAAQLEALNKLQSQLKDIRAALPK